MSAEAILQSAMATRIRPAVRQRDVARDSGSGRPADASTIEVDLGARIRALRLARGATLRELSAQAGVTESFLSQVERGVASPSIATVQRIARALGRSI